MEDGSNNERTRHLKRAVRPLYYSMRMVERAQYVTGNEAVSRALGRVVRKLSDSLVVVMKRSGGLEGTMQSRRWRHRPK